jgi:hypothetical protein
MRAKPRSAHALNQHLLHRPAALTWSLDVVAHSSMHGLGSINAHDLPLALLLSFSLNYREVCLPNQHVQEC